jgi:hypothetical protein
MEALLTQETNGSEPAKPAPSEATDAPPTAAAPAAGPPGIRSYEEAVIAREAERTGVGQSLLVALRRTENGGPGREFGVLSVPADGLDAQARVAANTVRNTIRRFERQDGAAVDPISGQYTEDFLRFLSARYAPLGAGNDPAGLNRYHAANLIAHYRKARASDG